VTSISFVVNGAPTEVDVPGMRRLLDVLREDLGLTGAKEGCGEGECGACSVLLDGMVVDACLVPICQVDGAHVRTVEGLAHRPDHGAAGTADSASADSVAADDLDNLQAAFLQTGGAQCGICTPGMLMAGHAFLASGAPPTDEAIREAIAGNLCRCTGYTKIVEAIALAAGRPAPPRGSTGASAEAS
jgi:aerobic carbon-monoxide dehydrogenase small subunit